MKKILMALSILMFLSACSNSDDQDTGKKNPENIAELIPSMDDYSKEEQEKIEHGRELSNNTQALLPDNVGNRLACASCHAGAGTGDAINLIGVTKKFPQYSKREGKDVTLEERINGCFMRSMDGKPIDEDSEEMEAFMAFYKYISDGVESGDEYPFMTESLGADSMPEPDPEQGGKLIERYNCMTCHGDPTATNPALSGPDLFGEGSFNDGAGMARLSNMQGFIKKHMPLDDPGTLSEQEAADLAAYVLMQERPEFEGENKFPDGGKPDDYMDKETREKIKNNVMKWSDFDVVKKHKEK